MTSSSSDIMITKTHLIVTLHICQNLQLTQYLVIMFSSEELVWFHSVRLKPSVSMNYGAAERRESQSVYLYMLVHADATLCLGFEVTRVLKYDPIPKHYTCNITTPQHWNTTSQRYIWMHYIWDESAVCSMTRVSFFNQFVNVDWMRNFRRVTATRALGSFSQWRNSWVWPSQVFTLWCYTVTLNYS